MLTLKTPEDWTSIMKMRSRGVTDFTSQCALVPIVALLLLKDWLTAVRAGTIGMARSSLGSS